MSIFHDAKNISNQGGEIVDKRSEKKLLTDLSAQVGRLTTTNDVTFQKVSFDNVYRNQKLDLLFYHHIQKLIN